MFHNSPIRERHMGCGSDLLGIIFVVITKYPVSWNFIIIQIHCIDQMPEFISILNYIIIDTFPGMISSLLYGLSLVGINMKLSVEKW